ncbi:MAG: hypothetical protein QQN55_01015 [Nitrosopumilus sp.]
MIIETLIAIGLIILGFLIAEFQNAYIGKQEELTKIYFSFIGVTVTQKDIQRLFFAIGLGIGMMFLLPVIIKYTGYEIDGKLIYIIVGYSPSSIMMLIKKKLKSKTGMGMKQNPSVTGGMPDPKKEQK